MDNLFWDTQFPPLPVETTGARCCPAPTAQIKLFLEIHSGHVNNDSGPGAVFIHFAPESLFTSSRNPYSYGSGIHHPHAPEYADFRRADFDVGTLRLELA